MVVSVKNEYKFPFSVLMNVKIRIFINLHEAGIMSGKLFIENKPYFKLVLKPNSLEMRVLLCWFNVNIFL